MAAFLPFIMAILSFFLAGGSKKENRGKAAAVALGVGAATYGVMNYTDWGQDLTARIDGTSATVGPNGEAMVDGKPVGNTTNGQGVPGIGSVGSGNNGLWNTISGWLTSPAGQLTTGAVAGKALGVPNWLLWGGIGLGAYLLLKD